MQVEQRQWTSTRGWQATVGGPLPGSPQLVLTFGAPGVLRDPARMQELRSRFPEAHLLGCSTAGEICGTQVVDDSIVATAIRFEHTHVKVARVDLNQVKDSHEAGIRLAASLEKEGLSHIFVLSDGLKINGSDLVKGLRAGLPAHIVATGGLSADGARFEHTFVFLNGPPDEGVIAAVGFYGSRLKIGFGSLGGWDPFGPERRITRSKGNVLYEFEGQSALALYKKFLGDYAAGLPATGLLFPLALRTTDPANPLVRTLLSINESEQSVTFAGDVPEGSYARLMKANFERLIDGAIGAAKSTGFSAADPPDLAVLVSCVGRKLVLKQRIEEEVEGVREVLGNHPVLTGFYSYGEIGPFNPSARCELHNQTMTITTFQER